MFKTRINIKYKRKIRFQTSLMKTLSTEDEASEDLVGISKTPMGTGNTNIAQNNQEIPSQFTFAHNSDDI